MAAGGEQTHLGRDPCLIQRPSVEGAVADFICRILPCGNQKARRGRICHVQRRIKDAISAADVAREKTMAKSGRLLIRSISSTGA